MPNRLTVLPGFASAGAGSRLLLFDEGHGDEIGGLGLDDPQAWESRLGSGGDRPGRGASGRLETSKGQRLVLKRLRRGGLAGPLWRDRFLGANRLLDNLRLPRLARDRGVATPAPVALLLVEGPVRFFRGWLALEEIGDARDLLSSFGAGPPPAADELRAAMRQVRKMHDAGIEHRDLNLGNLLVRRSGDDRPEAFVIDLDGARLHPQPLTPQLRRDALLRLERSVLKTCHLRGEPAPGRRWWFEDYADDEAERRELSRATALRGLALFLHRLGWRR